MDIQDTDLPDVKILTPRRFGDARGWFSETWNQRSFDQAGIAADFVQDNHSYSAQIGTLRGLHYQSPPAAQDKLVRVVAGRIWDVAVDIRKGSPHYGQWVGAELSADTGAQLWVPKGFLHGFVTLAPDTEVIYKCTDFYAPDCDGAVRFDDADLGIDWGYEGEVQLSDKDAAAQSFADFDSPFTYEAAP